MFGGYVPPDAPMCESCGHRAAIADGICYPCRRHREDGEAERLRADLDVWSAWEGWCLEHGRDANGDPAAPSNA